MKRALLLTLLVHVCLISFSQIGYPDNSFNGKGWGAYSFLEKSNYGNEFVADIIKQSDNYLLLISIGEGHSVIARYTSAGILDNTFGTDGFSVPFFIRAAKMQIQPSDGKIVVVGNTTTEQGDDIVVARFTPSGVIDTDFGESGKLQINLSLHNSGLAQNDIARSLAIQEDGKIVVAASTTSLTGGDYDFAVLRLTSEGSIDGEFGEYGSVITDISNHNDDNCYSIAIQPDGKIVVGGESIMEGFSDFAIVRYTSSGALDTDFSGDGIAILNFYSYTSSSSDERGRGIALQPDGKIIIAGVIFTGLSEANDDLAIARFTTTGLLDTDFGISGIRVTDLGGWDGFNDVMMNGTNIVAYGWSNNKIVLARFTSSGSFDGTFGDGGVVMQDLSTFTSISHFLVQPSDNKIIAVGSILSTTYDMLVLKYQESGLLDNTFDDDGILTDYYPTYPQVLFNGICRQPDGKLLLAGTTYNSTNSSNDIVIVRLNKDGSYDTDFNGTGKLIYNIGLNIMGDGSNDEARAIAIQSNGKIIVGGTTIEGEEDSKMFILKLTTAGIVDTEFGNGGVVTNTFGAQASGNAVVVDNLDRIIICGPYWTGTSRGFALARYTSAGMPDNTFDLDGIATTDIGSEAVPYVLKVQPDGKILAAGSAYNTTNENNDFAITRYSTAGVLDKSFGSNGIVTLDFGGIEAATSMGLQSDGRIVLAGPLYSGLPPFENDLALARFSSHGTFDNTFGNRVGKIILSVGVEDEPKSIAIQEDDKIILVGNSTSYYKPTVPFILRYLPDGILDNTFAGDGIYNPGFAQAAEFNSSTYFNYELYVAGMVIVASENLGLAGAYITGNKLPEIKVDDITVDETAGTATLTVTSSTNYHPALTINYLTEDVTAVSKGKSPDYKTARGSVVIPEYSTTAYIPVSIYQNASNDVAVETFNLKLSLSAQMSKQAIFEDAIAKVTINDVAGLTAPDEQEKIGNTENANMEKLSVKAYPNPTTGFFTLQLQSVNTALVSIRVLDAAGKLIESKVGVAANSNVQLGSNYRAGVYYAEVIQGNEKVTVKLIKQSE